VNVLSRSLIKSSRSSEQTCHFLSYRYPHFA
jgi:hypothetical protein